MRWEHKTDVDNLAELVSNERRGTILKIFKLDHYWRPYNDFKTV